MELFLKETINKYPIQTTYESRKCWIVNRCFYRIFIKGIQSTADVGIPDFLSQGHTMNLTNDSERLNPYVNVSSYYD